MEQFGCQQNRKKNDSNDVVSSKLRKGNTILEGKVFPLFSAIEIASRQHYFKEDCPKETVCTCL